MSPPLIALSKPFWGPSSSFTLKSKVTLWTGWEEGRHTDRFTWLGKARCSPLPKQMVCITTQNVVQGRSGRDKKWKGPQTVGGRKGLRSVREEPGEERERRKGERKERSFQSTGQWEAKRGGRERRAADAIRGKAGGRSFTSCMLGTHSTTAVSHQLTWLLSL